MQTDVRASAAFERLMMSTGVSIFYVTLPATFVYNCNPEVTLV